jgi:hypothetical protein
MPKWLSAETLSYLGHRQFAQATKGYAEGSRFQLAQALNPG